MANKILIVDDEIDTLRLVGLMLERQGYEIVVARNGAHALGLLSKEKPDLIVLDVMMPDMDGFKVAKKIRNRDEWSDLPILMFTAKANQEAKILGLESGANAYITKPTQPRELFSQVRSLLDQSAETKIHSSLRNDGRGLLIGVIAAKGGLGVSTIGINLGITFYLLTEQKSLIVDLQPGRGDVGWNLGLNPTLGLSDLIDLHPSLISAKSISNYIVTHDSGVHLLLSNQSPQKTEMIYQSEKITQIVSNLPNIAKWITIDLGSTLLPTVQLVTKLCDTLLIVLSPDPLIIRQSNALITALISTGIEESRLIPLLVNRFKSSPPLTLQQVEEQLGHTIPFIFSPATKLAQQASISNIPMVFQKGNQITANQYNKLAELIITKKTQPEIYETSPERTS